MDATRTEHATTSHYAIPACFFESFLDPYLKYSSGWYESPSDTLEVAIVRMLDRVIEAADLSYGARVLEVGFGWGSLLRRLSEVRPDVQYHGVAPSADQRRYVERRFGENSRLHTSSFEQFECTERFDAVFFIGSFCHLQEKEAQLAKAQSFLRADGTIVVEDTFFLSQRMYQRHASLPQTRFLQEEVFGFAHITAVSAFLDQAHESGLKVRRLEENTESYRHTIRAWLQRLEGSQISDTANFVRYLRIAQAGWGYTIGNYLISLQKGGRKHQSRRKA